MDAAQLRTLRSYRASVWRHGLLFFAARAAAHAGMVRAAIDLQEEGVSTAERIGLAEYEAEALLALARLHVHAGDFAGADADLARASAALGRVESATSRAWLGADRLELLATRRLPDDPAFAAAALDSVVAFFAERGNVLRLASALGARAEALLALGRTGEAERDLERVVALVEEQGRGVGSLDRRAGLFDAAQASVDRLISLALERGDALDALRVLERARAVLGRGALTNMGSRDVASRSAPDPGLPPGTAALEYALLGDTLVAWAVRAGALSVHRAPVAVEELHRLADRVHALAARHSGACSA